MVSPRKPVVNSTPKVNIHIDDRYDNKEETYPVCLYIYYAGKKKLYPLFTETKATLDYWVEREKKGKKYETVELRIFIDKVRALRERVKQILDSMPVFSIDGFIERWKMPDPKDTETVKYAFDKYIEDLNEDGRVGTARSYGQASVSFNKFRDGCKIKDVTVQFLACRYRTMVPPRTVLW